MIFSLREIVKKHEKNTFYFYGVNMLAMTFGHRYQLLLQLNLSEFVNDNTISDFSMPSHVIYFQHHLKNDKKRVEGEENT